MSRPPYRPAAAAGWSCLQCIVYPQPQSAAELSSSAGGLRTHMSSDQPSKKQKTTADTMVQAGDKIPPVVIDYGFGDDQEKVQPLPDLLCPCVGTLRAVCLLSSITMERNVPRNNSHPRRLAPRAARCHPRCPLRCGEAASARPCPSPRPRACMPACLLTSDCAAAAAAATCHLAPPYALRTDQHGRALRRQKDPPPRSAWRLHAMLICSAGPRIP